MHQLKIIAILTFVCFGIVGNFSSGSIIGGSVLSGVLVVFGYLTFVSKSAVNLVHFKIAWWINAFGILFAIGLMAYPVVREISGKFGSAGFIVTGFTMLFPFLIFREAIAHRKSQLPGATESGDEFVSEPRG